MLHQERVKQLSSGVLMGRYSLSTLVKIKSIVKWSNNSYHSLCTSGAINVPTASFNPCFNFDAPNHGVGSLPHKKYQNNIAEKIGSSPIWSKAKVEVEEARRGPSALKIRVILIETISNSKAIGRKMEMEILRKIMGFTLLTTSGCAYVARVVGLIPHTQMSTMIHGLPVWKIINP